MWCFLWLLSLGPPVAPALGMNRVAARVCYRWQASNFSGLFQDGDVIIGGLFSLYSKPPSLNQDFTQQPLYQSCSRYRISLPLQYVYAMLFALEEINHSTTLLPGVRLGFHLHDSCALPLWALHAVLSLHLNVFVSQMSYTASSPSLSDRTQFPNFFRTMPSDIYQARAIARLTIRFKWTWIGAVVANNDYGLMAETQGAGVCLAFVETLSRQNIVSDARRAAQAIQSSAAKVILIFTWYTDVRELFLQLVERNVTDRQFLASEAWSTSGVLLQNPSTSKVAKGVLGVAIRSSTLPGFEKYLRKLKPSLHPHNEFLREYWENIFQCRETTPDNDSSSSESPLPFCSGTESLETVNDIFTDMSQLRVTYNVYQAVYAVAHALHSLLSCPDISSSPANKNFNCSVPKQIKPIEVNRNISNSSHSCEPCRYDYWSNAKKTACLPRHLDFLSYNETLGITLTVVSVSGVTVTTAVFVVFLHYRQTPMVRANNSELSFLLLVSLKLCFLCSLVFIGRPSAWSCRFQQAAFGISFVLSVSCLKVKTIVVLAAFRSAHPGAEALMRWFGPGQQRGSICLFTSIQIVICIIWLTVSPPVPKPDFELPGLKVTLRCAMASAVGFSLVLGYIGLLACSCLILAFLARKLPDNFNEAKLITFSMLIFCAVWVAFIPAYVSSPGKYAVAVEIFAILASSYGLLLCIFAPKCFIILLRPENNTKKHMMAR
uniref:Olfactory receptor C family, r1 n=1 Tax=Cynoglossus semilaevis TaxID=244447 RepID=A0A3P8W293_CYNSE